MKVKALPSIPSRLRPGLTLAIVIMVITSPVLVLVNPTQVSAATTSNDSNRIDSSGYHSTPSIPAPAASSPLSSSTPMVPAATNLENNGDFTIQAALSSLTARPTNNIVNTNSFYDVVFLTATAGAIKTIEVTFPAGTTIPSGAFFNEAEGIGPGTASKSGQTIMYTVTNAVNVPAGTKIRLEFANINNPLQPSASYQVIVTTRNAANAIIDGPSQSTAYTVKQIGTNAIADNSITSTKPAESLMFTNNLIDNSFGNALGWNPDGVTTSFTISASKVVHFDLSFVTILVSGTGGVNHFCDVVSLNIVPSRFVVQCSSAPPNGAHLHYMVTNLPLNYNSP